VIKELAVASVGPLSTLDQHPEASTHLATALSPSSASAASTAQDYAKPLPQALTRITASSRIKHLTLKTAFDPLANEYRVKERCPKST